MQHFQRFRIMFGLEKTVKLSGGIGCVLPCDVPASLAVCTALLSLDSLNQEYAAHLLLAGA